MKILAIEPFFGGSHKAFLEGWAGSSAHSIDIRSLPARHWKWRQTGSALHFAESLPPAAESGWDALFVGGMCDLAHLRALRPDLPPALLYVHENQFAYPLEEGEERDWRYGITDLASMAAADRVVFNSDWNRQSFISGCSELFRRLPDAVPSDLCRKSLEDSVIVHPGIDGVSISALADSRESHRDNPGPPLVIWNHRHEHDKDPDTSVRVLEKLAEAGADFRLALLGERYRRAPEAFDRLRRSLGDRISFDAFPPRDEYLGILTSGDIVISSALQENFGIAVVEAVCAGCLPLLPDRLAYPEVMPRELHDACLWKNEEDYSVKLESMIRDIAGGLPARAGQSGILWRKMMDYDWSVISPMLDRLMEGLSCSRRRQI